MPVAACLLVVSGSEQFACNPYRSVVADFVSSVIRVAWESCRNPRVRNALGACGRYVDLEFPREPEPPEPEVSRIAVLGTPEARAELLRQLKAHRRSV